MRLTLTFLLLTTGCMGPVTDRATQDFQDCSANYVALSDEYTAALQRDTKLLLDSTTTTEEALGVIRKQQQTIVEQRQTIWDLQELLEKHDTNAALWAQLASEYCKRAGGTGCDELESH